MRKIDQLFVIWAQPEARRRLVIGRLGRDGSAFTFGYDLARGAQAQAHGFSLLPEFPTLRPLDAPYRAAYLFSTFGQRIPSPERPDDRETLKHWGVPDSDDPLDILAASGGLLATDALEVSEYRSPTDELMSPLRFRVSAEAHFEGGPRLAAGDALTLQLDKANPLELSATLLLAASGAKVGFGPRQYSELFARLLRSGVSLEAKAVARLALPPERDRWVVEAFRTPPAAC